MAPAVFREDLTWRAIAPDERSYGSLMSEKRVFILMNSFSEMLCPSERHNPLLQLGRLAGGNTGLIDNSNVPRLGSAGGG